MNRGCPLCGYWVSLSHFELLNLAHPAPERGDVGGQGVDVDALSGEDDAVLTLVGGNLNSPVNDDVKALLVDSLAICLVVTSTSINNQLIKLGVTCINRVGMLADLSTALANMHVMIHSLFTKESKDSRVVIYLTITVP